MAAKVNYIQHHKNVFVRLSKDDVSSIDISIYNALFLLWNANGFCDTLSINRSEVMALSKVGNANTYTKSLKKLHEKEYIIYYPSFNPLIGSKVSIINYGKGGGKSSDIGGGNGNGKGSGDGGDTLYKHYNTLTQEQIKHILSFFDSLPFDVLQEKLKELKPVKENDKIDFHVFWDLYGRKKGNKDKVEKKWNNLSLSTQERIIKTLPAFKNSVSDPQFLPYPETYLNNGRWNDELTVSGAIEGETLDQKAYREHVEQALKMRS